MKTLKESLPLFAESCVISEDLDNHVASMSKAMNVVSLERVAMNGIDSMSENVVALVLV